MVNSLSEIDGDIVEYDPSMAKDVAEMFNQFKESWPGGFGGGIPFDEERVRDWLDESFSIVDYVAVDEEGVPVGFCNLEPHWKDKDAAYVELLGVISRAKGKKFGKRLLLKTIEKAIEEGIKRVDLHTWSGNLKAMPLYKKVGMFWVPETTAYMQDYIPLLHQNDLTKEWFNEHPDWYDSQRRELKQEPDDLTIDDVKIYRYIFENEEDRIEVDIDRYGWGITGINRKLRGEEITVKAKVRSHDLHIGIENEYILLIENKTEEDKEIKIDIDPFPGIEFEDDFPSMIKVEKGEKKTLTRKFLVKKDVETYTSNHEASEVINTKIKMDKKEFKLTTGGKIKPAVEVKSQRDFHPIFSAQKKDLYFDLKNNTEKRLEVKIECEIEDREEIIDLELDEKENRGFKLPVKVDFKDDCIRYLRFTPSIKKDSSLFPMETYKHPVVRDTEELLEFVEKDDELFLVNDQAKVKVELEGGNVKVSELMRDSELPFEIRQQVGPPFGRSPDSSIEYEYEVKREEDYIILVLNAESLHKPGALMKKYIKLKKRSSEIEFWSEIENVADDPLECGAQTNTRKWGLDTELYQSKARIYTPLGDEIIESDPVTDMLSSTLLPTDPAEWEETWTAYEDFGDCAISGIIWDDEKIKKVKMARGLLEELKSATEKIEPGDSFKTSHLWISMKKPSLNSFRQTWNRLVGKKEIELNERIYGKECRKHLEVRIDENIIEAGKSIERELIIDRNTDYPMPGEYSLRSSEQVEVSFENGEKIIRVSEEEDEKELRLPLEINVSEDPEEYLDTMELHFSGERELDFEIPVIIIDSTDVKIGPQTREGEKLFRVDNGEIKFDVLDKLGGNLINLETSEGNSYLADSFPESKPKSWFENLLGGIEPRFMTPEDYYSFYETEKNSSEEVREGIWKGVKVDYEIQKHDHLRGQKFSVKYLTLPGTKLIKIEVDHEDPKGREIDWLAELFIDVLLNDSLEGTKVKCPGKYEDWKRLHQQMQFSTPPNIEKPWFRFSKKDISLSGFAVKGSPAFPSVICNSEINMALLISNMISSSGSQGCIELGIALDLPEKDIDRVRSALEQG